MSHLKALESGRVELWGGPVYIEADNISPRSQLELDLCGAVLQYLWERPGDDGMCWRRKMVLAGVRVEAVTLYTDDRAHVLLPGGSWVRLDENGVDLAEDAVMLEIFRSTVQFPSDRPTWQSLNVASLSFTKQQ